MSDFEWHFDLLHLAAFPVLRQRAALTNVELEVVWFRKRQLDNEMSNIKRLYDILMTRTLRGAQLFNSTMPETSVKVTWSPSDRLWREFSRHVTSPVV